MERDREKIVSENPDTKENDLRLDDSTDLAFDLDVFLRKNVYAYAKAGRGCHEGMERLADELLSGQTSHIRWWLELACAKEELKDGAMALMARVRGYEKAYGILGQGGKASVREQLADMKKQAAKEKENRAHRKRGMEK